eukprot:IDg23046t1
MDEKICISPSPADDPKRKGPGIYILHKQSVKELRALMKIEGVRQCGSKNSMLCKLMMHAKQRIENGKYNWDDVFGPVQSAFWSKPINQAIHVRVAPQHSVIVQYSSEVADIAVRTRKPPSAPPLASFEFARLLSILTQHDGARAA